MQLRAQATGRYIPSGTACDDSTGSGMAATAKVRTSASLWLGKEEMQDEPTFAEINQVRSPFRQHHRV